MANQNMSSTDAGGSYALPDNMPAGEIGPEDEKGIESAIGRVGLAWMGMIVLMSGILFFTEYLDSSGKSILSAAAGYASVVATWFIARYFRISNQPLYIMFGVTALIIGFYITMRLHFFTSSPALGSANLVLILMLAVCACSFYLSIKRNKQVFGILGLIFTAFTSVVSNSTHIMLPLTVVASAGSFFLYSRFRFKGLYILTIILSYSVFFIWIFDNPPMSHSMQLISDSRGGYIYLFLTGTIFSLLPLQRETTGSDDEFQISALLLHGLFFTLLLGLVTAGFFKTGYVPVYGVIALTCLVYSAFLRHKTGWNFSCAFFALYAFMAMSIALYGLVGIPHVYPLLSLQSLVVVSIALWFRNRLIVMMNILLFAFILFIYLVSAKPGGLSDFSFAAISLVSARIINWKKERLEIKTEIMRNIYLLTGFFMVMSALYHSLPGQFVALSWTVAALIYFGLSFLLKNVKYRYMALGTIISAAIYLFAVDLARIGIIYRVMALIFLAVVSIGISVYYSNRLRKTGE